MCLQQGRNAGIGGESHDRIQWFDVRCVAVKSDSEFIRSSCGKMIMLVQNVKE